MFMYMYVYGGDFKREPLTSHRSEIVLSISNGDKVVSNIKMVKNVKNESGWLGQIFFKCFLSLYVLSFT
ncbi:hypothetical protein L1987_52567 [Smallanthus sonchifolius]|uniref:Uncharacterized protein n=1 Tax=Smallanthus sonchifolius TaxID=185202 RepID=A0ACB9ESX3_9ASTR|nr:hypothetical protein L1987_52567 [Smallanthus sonchifolius]